MNLFNAYKYCILYINIYIYCLYNMKSWSEEDLWSKIFIPNCVQLQKIFPQNNSKAVNSSVYGFMCIFFRCTFLKKKKYCKSNWRFLYDTSTRNAKHSDVDSCVWFPHDIVFFLCNLKRKRHFRVHLVSYYLNWAIVAGSQMCEHIQTSMPYISIYVCIIRLVVWYIRRLKQCNKGCWISCGVTFAFQPCFENQAFLSPRQTHTKITLALSQFVCSSTTFT